MTTNARYTLWLERLASVKLTLVCLALAMILIVLGTLAQVHMGTFAAQKEYFNSWWLFGDIGDSRLPIFPGGLTLGTAWMAGYSAAKAAIVNFSRAAAAAWRLVRARALTTAGLSGPPPGAS